MLKYVFLYGRFEELHIHLGLQQVCEIRFRFVEFGFGFTYSLIAKFEIQIRLQSVFRVEDEIFVRILFQFRLQLNFEI